MSGTRTTRPRSVAEAASWVGASRAASATRSNGAPAIGGVCSATGHASAGRGQGSGVSFSPSQERKNEIETDAAFSGTRVKAGGCGGERGERIRGSQRNVRSGIMPPGAGTVIETFPLSP